MQHDSDWQHAHHQLTRIAKSRAQLDWEEGTWLVRALRSGAHVHLGFASFAEYVERLFGYGPRWIEERLRVAEALEGLPLLAQSLRDGVIAWSLARELTRVANAQNEGAWLHSTRGCTARQVEQMVSGHKLGDAPSDPTDAALRRHAVHMEVSAETFATFREAMAKLRRDAGEPLDDDAAMLLMARTVLGGPVDEGRSSYQVALTVCEGCGRGWQQARGEQVEVPKEVMEMAACDAQHLPSSSPHVGGSPARATQDIAPALRRRVLRRDGAKCVVPGCRHATFVDLHHITLRSEEGTHDEDNLITLCGAHHRANHDGTLCIEGRVSTGLVFRHADGSSYGVVGEPCMADSYAQAFRALRKLGFKEREARSALDRVRRAHVGAVRVEQVIRDALGVLTTERSVRTAQPVALPS